MLMLRMLKFLISIYSARLGRDLSLPPSQVILQLIGAICFFYLHVISFSLIVSRFSFPGWSISQMWILLYSFEIYTYMAFFLFWRGFNHTVRDINSGGLDQIICKPINNQLITFFRGGGVHNLISGILGLIYLISTLMKYQLPVSWWSVLIYGLTLLTSLWFLYSFTLLFISLNFCFGKLTATSSAALQLQEFFKYPGDIFSSASIILMLLVIPFTSLVSFPVSLLLHKPLSIPVLIIYISALIIITAVSQLAWRLGLRHYSSASS